MAIELFDLLDRFVLKGVFRSLMEGTEWIGGRIRNYHQFTNEEIRIPLRRFDQ